MFYSFFILVCICVGQSSRNVKCEIGFWTQVVWSTMRSSVYRMRTIECLLSSLFAVMQKNGFMCVFFNKLAIEHRYSIVFKKIRFTIYNYTDCSTPKLSALILLEAQLKYITIHNINVFQWVLNLRKHTHRIASLWRIDGEFDSNKNSPQMTK